VADFHLTHDLLQAARDLGVTVHTGVFTSGDAFYGPRAEKDMELMRRAGVVAVEMEMDALYILGLYHGWRCAGGAVLDGGEAKKIEESSSEALEIANHGTNPLFIKGEDDLITMALEAMVRCAERDKAGEAAR